MKTIAADLLAQYEEAVALAAGLTAEQWQAPTPFYGWSPWDEIAHLCFFDEAGLLAVRDEEAFRHDAAAVITQMLQGTEISGMARQRYGHLSGSELLEYWRPRFADLVAELAALEPKARLPWYGPPMSARSFATARLMETWAHSQDIYDAIGRRRPVSERIRHIAHLGVSTYGWTFLNRNLPVPEPIPYVALRAPSGETWSWNQPSATDFVRGDAEEFCLVVTQRRNVEDTELEYSGASATQWLRIAQCFAGYPADGPAPGVRAVQYPVSGDKA